MPNRCVPERRTGHHREHYARAFAEPGAPASASPCACRSCPSRSRSAHHPVSGSSHQRFQRSCDQRRRRVAGDLDPRAIEVNLHHRRSPARTSLGRNHHLSKVGSRSCGTTAKLPAPAIQLVGTNICRRSNLGHHRARRKRRQNQRPLLLNAPATPSLHTRKYRHLSQSTVPNTSANDSVCTNA
jgi:hypothetical protein